MRFLPYSKHCFDESEVHAVTKIVSSGIIARGPTIEHFEQKFADKLGYSSAISCTNGSAAIEIALRAAGISSSHEVIVTTLSWAATATAVSMVGATPVFADISNSDYCINPNDLSSLYTSRTKAIIVVHFAGVPCDMDSIWAFAESHDLLVIEDCAHALGGSYLDGSPIGSSVRTFASTFSLHPAKNITSGEGGVIVTSSRSSAELIRLYRSGGVKRSMDSTISKAFYDITVVSSNFHMTDIQAAIGIVQLDKLDLFVSQRRAQVNLYNQLLVDSPSIQIHNHPSCSAANLYIPLLSRNANRDVIMSSLISDGIGAYFHYPPLHQSSLYKHHHSVCPSAEDYAQRAITLPLGPHLTDSTVSQICANLKSLISS